MILRRQRRESTWSPNSPFSRHRLPRRRHKIRSCFSDLRRKKSRVRKPQLAQWNGTAIRKTYRCQSRPPCARGLPSSCRVPPFRSWKPCPEAVHSLWSLSSVPERRRKTTRKLVQRQEQSGTNVSQESPSRYLGRAGIGGSRCPRPLVYYGFGLRCQTHYVYRVPGKKRTTGVGRLLSYAKDPTGKVSGPACLVQRLVTTLRQTFYTLSTPS